MQYEIIFAYNSTPQANIVFIKINLYFFNLQISWYCISLNQVKLIEF